MNNKNKRNNNYLLKIKQKKRVNSFFQNNNYNIKIN